MAAPSFAALPNLSQKLATYDSVQRPALSVVCFGSSIGSLVDTANRTTCENVTASLNALVNPAGASTYNLVMDNESVPGSVVADFSTSWSAAQSKGVTPAVCVFVYGMNDAQPIAYNSGETFAGFQSRFSGALSQCKTAHADNIILTSPDGRVMATNNSPLQQALPDGYNQSYPVVVASPVPCVQHIPTCTSGSIALPDGKGNFLYTKVRFDLINDTMRQLAQSSGGVLVEADVSSYQAVLARIQSGQSQSVIEDDIYGIDSDNIAHPSKADMQQFYSAQIVKAFSAIAGGSTGSTSLTGIATYSGPGFVNPGPLSGSGSVLQNGPGTLLLLGTNSYAGGTSINGGAIFALSDAAFGVSSGLLSFSNGTLIFGGSGTMARPMMLNSGGATINTAVEGFQLGLSGVISGSGSLSKTGPGALILSGVSTYSGGTTVSGGELLVLGSISSAVTVKSGGTLAGTGSVGATMIANGGKLFAGYAGAGPLTINGSLTIASGGNLAFTGNPLETTIVQGSADLAGTLSIAPGANVQLDRSYLLISTSGGVTGRLFAQPDASFMALFERRGRDLYVVLKPRLINASISGFGANVRGIGGAISSIVVDMPSYNAFAPLSNIPATSVQTTLSQMAGEAAEAPVENGLSMGRRFMDLMAPQTSTGPKFVSASNFRTLRGAGPRPGPGSKVSFWLSGYGSRDIDSGDGYLGTHDVNRQDQGAAVGVDVAVGRHISVGAAAAWGRSNWSVSGNNGSGSGNTLQVGLYEDYEGPVGYLKAKLAYSMLDGDLLRQLSLGGTNLYGASTQSRTGTASIEYGRRFRLSSKLRLTPYFGFLAQDARTPEFSEKTLQGSPTYALAFKSETVRAYQGDGGFNIGTVRTGLTGLTYDIRMGWFHQYRDQALRSASFEGFADSGFFSYGAHHAADRAHASLTMQEIFTSKISMQAEVATEFLNGTPSIGASMRVGYNL